MSIRAPRLALLLALILALTRCEASHESGAVTQKLPPPVSILEDPEPDNLLNYGRGAVVIERSGEGSLLVSALHAIDGDPASQWLTPTGDPNQAMVVSLPSRTEVSQVGISNERAITSRVVKSLQFEGSDDGISFQILSTIVLDKAANQQLFAVRPRALRFLRIALLESFGDPGSIEVPSILVRGKALEPPRHGLLGGAWMMNQTAVDFAQIGAHVVGADREKTPMEIDGGTDGVIYRFAWIRGPQHGLGAIAVDRDGKRASGVWWFEECNPYLLGAPWFGVRTDEANRVPMTPKVMLSYLGKLGRFPLYGIVFDARDQVDEKLSDHALEQLRQFSDQNPGIRLRFLAHEFRGASREANRLRSQVQIKSFKAVLIKRGVDISRHELEAVGDDAVGATVITQVSRAVYSTLEMKVIPSAH